MLGHFGLQLFGGFGKVSGGEVDDDGVFFRQFLYCSRRTASTGRLLDVAHRTADFR